MRWSLPILISAIFFNLSVLAAEGGSGLPIPRFVSLRAEEVNWRTGPGERYPVDWIYRRAGLPVEVIAEYETWRRVRDADGTEGWVHQRLLVGERRLIIIGATRVLHRAPDQAAAPVAEAEPGVIGQLLACSKEWCKVELEDQRGYLRKTDFWGAYPSEQFD